MIARLEWRPIPIHDRKLMGRIMATSPEQSDEQTASRITMVAKPTTGLPRALVWFLLFLVLQGILFLVLRGIIAKAIVNFGLTLLWQAPWLPFVAHALVTVVAALGMARYAYRNGVRETVSVRGCRPVQLVLVVLLGVALVPVADAASRPVDLILGWESVPAMAARPPFLERVLQSFWAIASLDWPWALLFGSLAPAIAEELFFRGVLGRRLVAIHGPVKGVLFTSLLFGLFHIDPALVVATFLLGIALHSVYLATRSLLAPVALHAAYNATVITAYKLSQANEADLFGQYGRFPSLIVLIASAATITATAWAIYRTRTRWMLPNDAEWSPGFVTAEIPPPELGARPLSTGSAAIPVCATALTSITFVLAVVTSMSSSTEFLAYRHIYRGNEFWEADKMELAILEYSEALQHSPNDSDALGNRGMALVRNSDYASGLADLDRALTIRPNDADLLIYRANAHAGLGHTQQALDDVNAVLRLRPRDRFAIKERRRLLAVRGDELFRANDLDGAITAYSEALKGSPDDAYTLANRGTAYGYRTDFAKSLADLDRALVLMPAQPDWLIYRAGAYLGLKDVDKALDDYAAVLRLRPDDAFALRQRGRILLGRENWQGALTELDHAALAGDESAGLKADRGRALYNLSRFDRAAAELEAALKLQPGHPAATYDLIWIKAACPKGTLRDGPRAVELAKGLHKAFGQSDAKLLSALAAAEAEAGNFAEAVRQQEAALKLAEAGEREFHEMTLALYRAGRPYRLEAKD